MTFSYLLKEKPNHLLNSFECWGLFYYFQLLSLKLSDNMWPNALYECLPPHFGRVEVPKEMECATPQE